MKLKDFDNKINSTKQNLDSKVDNNSNIVNNKVNDVLIKMNDLVDGKYIIEPEEVVKSIKE